jgi:hypothetical protein
MGVTFGSIYLKLYRKALDKKNPASIKRRGCCYENKSGGVLLSHAVTHVVSSALQGLTTEFGMGSVRLSSIYFKSIKLHSKFLTLVLSV